MDRTGAHVLRGVWWALLGALLALAVVPQRWLPEQARFIAGAQGEFAGAVVRVVVPEAATRAMFASVKVSMLEGQCSASLTDAAGTHAWGRAREATWGVPVEAGNEIVLDPLGNAGSYDVSIRLSATAWRALGPKFRHFVLLPSVLAALLTMAFRRRTHRVRERLRSRGVGPGRQVYVAALCVLCGLVLYPAVHESGHLLAGTLFGGAVDLDRVVWTALTGEEPHAAFDHLPDNAMPWMTASGTLLPPLVALLLLAIRRALRDRSAWVVSTTLLVVGVLFLLSTLGCLFELHRNTHLDALSVHFGLSGPSRVLFSLSPFIVATTVLTLMLRSWRRS